MTNTEQAEPTPQELVELVLREAWEACVRSPVAGDPYQWQAAHLARAGLISTEPKGRPLPSRAMKPTIGRIVHYVSHGTPGGEYTSECRAAIVTDVGTITTRGEVSYYPSLCVLNPSGMFFNAEVAQDETGKRGGTWHWPERD